MKENPLYWKLCQGLLRAQIKGLDYEKKMKGEFSDDLEKIFCLPDNNSQAVQPDQNKIESSPTLDEVVKQFWNWGVIQEEWKPRSQTDFKRCLNHMLNFLGRDRQIHTITDQDSHSTPHQYWLPILGLFTGARLEELCQLYVDDIKQVDGIWVLDINQRRQEQSVKSSEERLVPIHPFIVDQLGFVNFTKRIEDQNGRIFPNLRRHNDRYGHYPSRWFKKL